MQAAGQTSAARERWLRRVERAHDAFGLVLLMVTATYVVLSLMSSKGWPGVVVSIVSGATAVIALSAARAGPRYLRGGIALAVVAIGLSVAAAATDDDAWLNGSGLIHILLLGGAMAFVLGRVVTAADIGFRTILGALSVYAVLGILFTYLYSTIDRLQDGAFFEGVARPGGGDFLFFSYTTLTTTGYGDLVPGGQPGRMFAGLEMMIGQIFLVTLVAGLVSLWRPGEALRRRRERSQG